MSGVAAAATVPRHRDFNLLWAGQTVSQIGSQVSNVALPLTAIVSLHAGAAEVGALSALSRLPFLLYPLAGVWVDRVRRRPVLVVADLIRAALLLAVPAAALLHVLRLEVLYVVAAGVALMAVWFDTAYMTIVPSLVDRSRLAQANSRLEMSSSAAQTAGPGLGGALVNLLTAPLAVVADAVSYLGSALAVLLIANREPPARRGPARSVRAELIEGMRFVLGHPLLRLLMVMVALGNLLLAAQQAVYLVFVSRDLGLSPAAIGAVLAAAGPGAVAGALLAAPALRRLGLGATLTLGMATFAASALLVPLAPRSAGMAAAVLATGLFLSGLGAQVTSINVLTARQRVSPPHLLGRSNATFRFMGLAVSPVGALAAGELATAVGARTTLLVVAAGLLACPLVLVLWRSALATAAPEPAPIP